MRVLHSLFVAWAASLALSGCSSLESLPVVSQLPAMPEALRIEHTVDKPGNLIERALSGCDQRTEAGETGCVKKALTDAKVSVASLVAMLRDCRVGTVCHTVYTTDDRIGLYDATASRFVVHWRVTFDLRRPAKSIEGVPVTVVQV